MSDARAHPFVTTRWTQVIASQGNSEQAREALSDLCAAYYAPVVAFLAREGRSDDAARELAHEFFARVLERQSFCGAEPGRGRFRSYLLGALKHFLANRYVHESREKRGGGREPEPLHNGTDTSPDLIASATGPSTDAQFDREWALNLVSRALASMREEATLNEKLLEFEALKPWLTGETAARSHAEVAVALSLSEGAMRVAIHRLRRRFRELVNSEVARTVNDPADVPGEMRHLIEALA